MDDITSTWMSEAGRHKIEKKAKESGRIKDKSNKTMAWESEWRIVFKMEFFVFCLFHIRFRFYVEAEV